MDPFRDSLLFLSKQQVLQNILSTAGPFKKISKRFVSGETLEQGISASRELNYQGMPVSLDHLGESIANENEAKEVAREYIKIIEQVRSVQLAATVSLKLTQLGLDINYDLCLENIRLIMQQAKAANNLVTIDMESSQHTEVTLRIYQTLIREGFREVGIVLQSCLKRSETDLRKLLVFGPRVRLCKGAYKEFPSIAFPRKKDVDQNYLKLLSIILSKDSLARGIYPEVATHDERIIKWTMNFVREYKIAREQFEFQMLYGIRRDLQEKLVRNQYRVRVYLPYGTHWYPYFMRRLAERPANLIFLLKNFFRG